LDKKTKEHENAKTALKQIVSAAQENDKKKKEIKAKVDLKNEIKE
jgi:hypothetical protein